MPKLTTHAHSSTEIQFSELKDLEAGTLLLDGEGDLMMVVYDNTAEANTLLHMVTDRNHNTKAILWGGDLSVHFPAQLAPKYLKVAND